MKIKLDGTRLPRQIPDPNSVTKQLAEVQTDITHSTIHVDCQVCGAKDSRTAIDQPAVVAFALAWKRAHEGCFKGKPPEVMLTATLGAKK